MFSALFQRAQVTVDNAINLALRRGIVAIPFLVALGFATAALTVRLTREFGDELGYLAVAGVFVGLGLLTAILAFRPADQATSQASTQQDSATATAQSEPETASEAGNAVDKELMTAALASVAPLALPVVFRIVGRNLPLIAAVLAAVLLYVRGTTAAADEPRAIDDPVPAE